MSNSAEKLVTVRTPLLELHRLLLGCLKTDYEKAHGRVLPAAEWFQVLLGAPEFAWVKVMNTLISDVDALSEKKGITVQDMSILHHNINKLLFIDDEDVTSFNCHYRKVFSQNHELMYTHGLVKTGVSDWPLEPLPMNSDEIRLSWHKVGASRRTLMN